VTFGGNSYGSPAHLLYVMSARLKPSNKQLEAREGIRAIYESYAVRATRLRKDLFQDAFRGRSPDKRHGTARESRAVAHLGICGGGWKESTNEGPQTYQDCPLTLQKEKARSGKNWRAGLSCFLLPDPMGAVRPVQHILYFRGTV
jgi:hypothetical protein